MHRIETKTDNLRGNEARVLLLNPVTFAKSILLILTLILLNGFSRESVFASNPTPEYQEFLSTATTMQSRKEYADAIVQLNHALRCYPGSSAARTERAHCLRALFASREMTDPRFDEDRANITARIQELLRTWNTHDIEKVLSYYFVSYCNDDGGTIGSLSKATTSFWTNFPDAKSKWDIVRVLCDGKSGLVEINGRTQGTNTDRNFGKGSMQSDFHLYLLVANEEQQWSVSGCIQDKEKTLNTFGIGDTFALNLTAPNSVEAGKTFTAQADFSVAPPSKANVSILALPIKTPVEHPPSDDSRICQKPTDVRELTMNADGYNMQVTATVFATQILSIVGMSTCEQRVTVKVPEDEGVATDANSADVASAAKIDSSIIALASRGRETNTGGQEAAMAKAIAAPTLPRDTIAGAMATSNTATEAPIGDKWALIVGIEKFQDTQISKLQYAARDATDMYHYLINEAHFAPDHVRLLLNEKATERRILSEVGSKFLARVARPNDLVLIYLSTHGSPSDLDVKGNNFFVAYDTDGHDLFATGIEMQKIVEIIKRRIDSQRVLLVLDACHSGATNPEGKALVREGNFDANDIAQGTGQLVICSSEPSERSWESRRYKNGVFTHRLLEGLRLNGANTKLLDAFSYVKEHVSDEVRADRAEHQTPVIKSKWNGDALQLAVPPANPQQVPDVVRNELEPDSSDHAKSR